LAKALCQRKACKRLRELGGPEVAELILAADRLVDYTGLGALNSIWRDDPADRLRRAVLALRAKRERTGRMERVKIASGR